MEKDIEILSELLSEDAVVEMKTSVYGKTEVTLEEPQEGYSLRLRNLPEDSVVIKTDRFPAPDTFFKNGKGEAKRADYAIVAHTSQERWVVCIELKGGKPDSERHVIAQLKGGACLMAYCSEIGRRFWGRDDFLLRENYQYRFVSIRDLSLSKRPSRTCPNKGIHDIPERMLKLSSPGHLTFRQLVSAN